MVYVLSKSGKPLMPTDRYSHIRWLLKNNKAIPICNNPFTIRLKYDTPDVVQSLTLGIDVGRENIGLGVSDNKGNCLFLANVETKNKQVTKNMFERKVHRQERRRHKRQKKQRKALRLNQTIRKGTDSILRNKKSCKEVSICYPGMEASIHHKVIKGKEAKFNNRVRKEGWLTPSARNLVEIHVNLVKKIQQFLPLANLVVENNIFDFQKLENSDIRNWEYNKGILYGFKDYKDYISKQQGNKCLLCNNKIEHYHHIYYRLNNGSNTVSNFVGLCKDCHTSVHNDLIYEQELLGKKQGLKKKYEISLLNSCMSIIIEELSNLLPTTVCTGYDTKNIRNMFNLGKSHCIDGFAISLFTKCVSSIKLKSNIYNIKRLKRKSKGIIRKEGSRRYYSDGKLVAINRHKAFNQKEDSLEEFLNNFAEGNSLLEVGKLFHSLKVEAAQRVYSRHLRGVLSNFRSGDTVKHKISGKVFVVQYVKMRVNGRDSLVFMSGGSCSVSQAVLLSSSSLVFV